MKLLSMGLAALIATAGVSPAQADELVHVTQGATFLGATAAGIALGGPVGMVLGALGGVWYAERLEDASQLAGTRQELQASEVQLANLQQELVETRATNEQYATLVMEQLQLEMLFKTGASELTDSGKRRLQSVAVFLVDNPLINIQLDGYADPRGGHEYNLALSEQRVTHVLQLLSAAGVEKTRIRTESHGAGDTRAAEGDYDAYALERVVKIQLRPDTAGGLARTN